MFAFRLRAVVGAVFASSALAACGGGSPHTTSPPPASQAAAVPAQPQGVSVPLSAEGGSFAVPMAGGYNGTIVLGPQPDPRATTMTVGTESPAFARSSLSLKPCPAMPEISFVNPFPFAITIPIRMLTITAPCSINGQLFSVSFFTLPASTTDAVTPVHLGDVTGTGRTITFVPAVQSVTLPPKSRDEIAILPETAPGYTAFPVVPNVPTILTPGNGSHTSLAFKYDAASGGSMYQAECFDGGPPGVPPVGTAAFYCNLDPGGTPITFGTTQVRFFVGVPKPDGSVLGLDGTQKAFNCLLAAQPTECDTAQFAISNNVSTGFQNVVVGNVNELSECIFETCVNSDANQSSSPPPSSPIGVFAGDTFSVVVTDDPTYHAVTGAPWDGLLHASVVDGGPCSFTSPSTITATKRHPSSAASPSPAATTLPGPNATFTVTANAPGTCTIGIAEDPAFVTNVNGSPSRAVQETVTVSPTAPPSSPPGPS